MKVGVSRAACEVFLCSGHLCTVAGTVATGIPIALPHSMQAIQGVGETSKTPHSQGILAEIQIIGYCNSNPFPNVIVQVPI